VSKEVGSGHVAIFPVFKGMRKAISNEVNAGTKAASTAATRGFASMGRSSGQALGRGLKAAVTTSTANLGSDALKKFQRDVATSSRALSSARMKQMNDAGRVRVAEQQLAEVLQKHGAGSSQAVAAEERLAAARRNLSSSTSQVTAATSGLQAAQSKLKSLQDDLASSSSGASAAFARGWSGIRSVAGAAARGVQSAFSAAMGGVKRVAGDAARFVGSAFQGAGIAVAGILGVAFKKGFSRLESIDTARTKLSALGNTAEQVDTMMSKALNAVRGTAFGLGDAASAAAGLSAAKVPVKQMDKALQSMVSTAALSGSSLSDMSVIWNKAASAGKLSGETMAALLDRQVPILAMLQEHYGKTGEEVRKMVSAGKVSFEDFITVMGKNGEAAKVMGTSFRGMVQNVGAALGRFGATALQPVFDGLKAVMPGVISLLDQVASAVKPLFEAIGARLVPAMKSFGDTLSKIKFDGSGLSGLKDAIGPLLPVVGAVVGVLGTMITRLPLIGPLFAGLTAPLGLVVGGFVALTAFKPEQLTAGFESLTTSLLGVLPKISAAILKVVTEVVPQLLASIAANLPVLLNGFTSLLLTLVQSIAGVLPNLARSVAGVIPMIADTLLSAAPKLLNAGLGLLQGLVGAVLGVLPQVLDAVIGIVPKIAQTLLSMVPRLLTAGLRLFKGLIQAVVTVIPQIVSALVALLPKLVATVLSMLPVIITTGLNLLLGLVEGIVQAIPVIVTAIIGLIPVLVQTIVGMIPAIIQAGLQLFLGLVMGLVNAVPEIIVAIVNAIPQLISAIVSALPKLIVGAIQLFLGLVTGLIAALPRITSAILQAIPKLIVAIVSMLPQLIAGGLQLFLGLIVGLVKALPDIIKAVIDMIPKIVKAMIDEAPQLVQAGKDLIQGLIEGLLASGQKVLDAIGGIINDAIDWAKGLLGIHSPSKVFRDIGRFVGEGFVQGLKGSASKVESAAKSMISKIRKGMDAGVISKTAGASAIKAIKATTKEIQKALAEREKVLGKLKDAQKNLADLVKQRADFVAGVQSSVVGLGDVAGFRSVQGMVANLTKRIEATQKFQKTLDALTKLGLDATTRDQLLAQFQQDGSSKAADALLAGGKAAVDQVKGLQGQLSAAGAKLGNTVGDQLYKAGISAAQGLVKGLESQAAQLKKVADGLANSLVATVKKKLKIKSPSRVFADLGRFTMQGYAKGIGSQTSTVQRSVLAALPDASRVRAVASTMSRIVATQSASTSGSTVVTGQGDTFNLYGVTDIEEAFRVADKRKRRRVRASGEAVKAVMA